MEFVNDCLAVRKVVFDSFSEAERHITGDNFHVFQIALMLLEIVSKPVNGSMIFSLCGIDHFPFIKVDHHGYVIMTFLAGFIHANAVD